MPIAGRAFRVPRRGLGLACTLATLALSAGALVAAPDVELTLPLAPSSVRFAVIGDSGTGGRPQYEIGARMAQYHAAFPFTFVLMLGDNLYGDERPQDYVRKFERPYKPLLDAGVRFYASLGNHDNPSQRLYRLFNMNGASFYSFAPSGQDARFFALDSTYMNRAQLEWLEAELAAATERWKICFFHHPLYSSGERHGPDEDLREVLESIFVKHGVDVVFAGHEHFYERLKPQKGIYYFISGGAAKLRRGNIRPSGLTEKGFDQGYHFMLLELAGSELHFQVVSREDKTVDSGMIRLPS